jgi:hypothetical protein
MMSRTFASICPRQSPSSLILASRIAEAESTGVFMCSSSTHKCFSCAPRNLHPPRNIPTQAKTGLEWATGPTAKPNASSRPPCASGPTPFTGPIPSSATSPSLRGRTPTTSPGLMVAFTTSCPSAALIQVQRLDHLQAPGQRLICDDWRPATKVSAARFPSGTDTCPFDRRS